MLDEIIDAYEDFGDALITNVKYNSGYDFSTSTSSPETIEITISCFNKNRNHERDLLQIHCSEIIHFSLKKYNGMISQALLKKTESEFTLDFFPDLISKDSGGLIGKENLNSDCIIKCKTMTYEVMEKKASH